MNESTGCAQTFACLLLILSYDASTIWRGIDISAISTVFKPVARSQLMVRVPRSLSIAANIASAVVSRFSPVVGVFDVQTDEYLVDGAVDTLCSRWFNIGLYMADELSVRNVIVVKYFMTNIIGQIKRVY